MFTWTLLLGAAIQAGGASPDGPLIFHEASINQTSIVFTYAGDLWSVPRAGGDAVRLTAGTGQARSPMFSPDGSTIAFTSTLDGQPDVYVMPAEGGIPKRITFDPNYDVVVGWTPDGKSVLFSSSRLSGTDYPRLFTVPSAGGPMRPLPLPSGAAGSYSPDGALLAYSPKVQWEPYWRRYRGGQTTPIWIANLSDSKVKEIPRKNWNDKNPMWVGNSIYYLSDPDGSFGLYKYDVSTGSIKREVPSDPKWDIKSASEGAGAIVLAKFGSLEVLDLKSGSLTRVPVHIRGDIAEVHEGIKPLAKYVTNASLSPSGARIAVEARGRIFTVPASKGDPREITSEQGVAHRSPVWSPDGKSIAYFSDASGEYKIVIHDLAADIDRAIEPQTTPGFYYSLAWSPDGNHLSFTNMKGEILVTDVKSSKTTVIDTNPYGRNSGLSLSWSPDSKWVAYSRDLDSLLDAIFLCNVETGKRTQVTDGLSHAQCPVFDTGGKYLYFYASTTIGTGLGGNLSSIYSANPISSIYAVVLRKDAADPLEPLSDEEKPKADEEKPKADEPKAKTDEEKPKSDEKPATTATFRIDVDGIDQRIVALPVPARIYRLLQPGPEGTVFSGAGEPIAMSQGPSPTQTIYKFTLSDRKEVEYASGVTGLASSYSGDKVLVFQGGTLSIGSGDAASLGSDGAVKLEGLQTRIDPRTEWRQEFREGFRIERDYFYDPNHHGIDLVGLQGQFQPFLANLSSRDDLNYLFETAFGEMCVGHLWVDGGDSRQSKSVPGGLLGADYDRVDGHYRLAHVYSGENWNPELRAPLTQPGVAAKAGEYILAINGRALAASDDIDEALEGTAGKQVSIKVGPKPDGTGARTVTVIPLASESALRARAWEEDNRRMVDKLSGGKLGYFHVPDTEFEGWNSFNRYYYSQINKSGMVVDERFNHGGFVDDYMAQQMRQPLMAMFTGRYGKDTTVPGSANFGPKVLIINELAGSGGDYFPWNFRKAGVGPLIGKRTWGGLVGYSEFPALIDGGGVVAPNFAFYNPDGRWEIENHGVSPDIDVELDPSLWRQGHDAQLERAVAECMKLVGTNPGPKVKKPARPDKSTLAKAEAPN